MGWGGLCRDGMGHAGVRWDGVGCSGSCRNGVGHAGVGWVMQGLGGVYPTGVGWGGSCRDGMGHAGVRWGGVGCSGSCWGGSCRVSNPANQNQICRVSNLSTNIRVQKLQGTESRHATGYQI